MTALEKFLIAEMIIVGGLLIVFDILIWTLVLTIII
jgi:hypothetical protein